MPLYQGPHSWSEDIENEIYYLVGARMSARAGQSIPDFTGEAGWYKKSGNLNKCKMFSIESFMNIPRPTIII